MSSIHHNSCFSSRSTIAIVLGFVFTLLLTTYAPPVQGQGFEVHSKSAPSVIGAGTFVSLEGKFSIALPPMKHGFRPLSIETPAGRANGDAYIWAMKEGNYTAGFVDAPQAWDEPETSKRVFANLREGMASFANSNNGKLVSERSIELDKHAGLEVRIEFAVGVMIQRMYLVSRRLYQTVLIMKTEQHAFENEAIGVLDSLKLLNEAEVNAALKAAAAKAEPSPLPQEPVAKRQGTDAGDEGLHGKVKTVFSESQDLSGTWSVQSRKPTGMEYYNEQGNLTKRESYDWKGNLFDITVYGYLDGARVSHWKTIPHEYNPPPMMMATVPGAAKPKYDPRYAYKFDFKYDDKKRLIEKTWIGNDGKLWMRYVYKYSGNQIEEFVYSADGSLNQHYLSVLDEQRNEIEKTIFEVSDGKIRSKNSYAYEFDAKGNWTKQTSSKWVTKDGRSFYEPASVYYRTITYY